MATYLENLETRRNNIAEALASLTVGEGLDAPNHTGEHRVDRQQKIDSLTSQLAQVNELINEELERTPYTRESRGVT